SNSAGLRGAPLPRASTPRPSLLCSTTTPALLRRSMALGLSRCRVPHSLRVIRLPLLEQARCPTIAEELAHLGATCLERLEHSLTDPPPQELHRLLAGATVRPEMRPNGFLSGGKTQRFGGEAGGCRSLRDSSLSGAPSGRPVPLPLLLFLRLGGLCRSLHRGRRLPGPAPPPGCPLLLALRLRRRGTHFRRRLGLRRNGGCGLHLFRHLSLWCRRSFARRSSASATASPTCTGGRRHLGSFRGYGRNLLRLRRIGSDLHG